LGQLDITIRLAGAHPRLQIGFVADRDIFVTTGTSSHQRGMTVAVWCHRQGTAVNSIALVDDVLTAIEINQKFLHNLLTERG